MKRAQRQPQWPARVTKKKRNHPSHSPGRSIVPSCLSSPINGKGISSSLPRLRSLNRTVRETTWLKRLFFQYFGLVINTWYPCYSCLLRGSSLMLCCLMLKRCHSPLLCYSEITRRKTIQSGLQIIACWEHVSRDQWAVMKLLFFCDKRRHEWKRTKIHPNLPNWWRKHSARLMYNFFPELSWKIFVTLTGKCKANGLMMFWSCIMQHCVRKYPRASFFGLLQITDAWLVN